MKKGFTLIELLIVVAIIGILAGVGIPMYNGYMATAKINASTENHSRAKDMITAYFAKCSTGTATISLKVNSTTSFTDVACNSSMSSFADYWSKHFNNDGWQNPYSKGSTFAKKANGAGALGEMRFWYSGSSLTINTNVGDEDGKSKSLTASIMKE